MTDNNLYNNNQHGFRSGYSCLSQLIDHQQHIVQMLNEGNDVDVIYLDFAKAFDKVDHKILLRKLHTLGIQGEVLNWIKTFLVNRKQTVRIDEEQSEECEVKSGVPQGSVLGPLLFLIYISDINEGLSHTRASSFADDTRIIKNVKSAADCQLLQNDLEKVIEWAEENNMAFNTGKFELLRYTRGNDPVDFECKAGETTPITSKSNVTLV